MSGVEWAIGDDLTASRLNLKTRYVGTGAQIAALTPQTGQIAYCTSTGSGFTAGSQYVYSGSAWVETATSSSDVLVYPYSTTIGDYTTTSFTATASSNSSNTTYQDTLTRQTSNGGMGSAFNTRSGQKVTATSALIGSAINKVSIVMYKSGTPTGTANIRIRNSGDTIVQEIGTQDVSLLTTSPATYSYTFSSYTLASGDRISLEYTGGDGSNFIRMNYDTDGGSGYNSTSTHIFFYAPSSYNDASTGHDASMKIELLGASASIDGVTTTNWASTSSTNPWLRLEMSASADKEPAAIALMTESSTTATQLKIQTSTDGSTWTDKRLVNVSALTHGSYNYFRWNRDIAATRYIRVYGNDGTNKILSITEVKVLIPTESQWNRRHGHKSISATDATLGLTT